MLKPEEGRYGPWVRSCPWALADSYGDATVEANESFQLLLSNATGPALITDAVGMGTIVNDDVVRGPKNPRRMR